MIVVIGVLLYCDNYNERVNFELAVIAFTLLVWRPPLKNPVISSEWF